MARIAQRSPWHLWLVGVIAVLFNAIGVFDYVMSKAQGPAYLASAGMSPAQVAHYQAMPPWMTAVWAIGVFGAFGASVLLLLRRRLAFPTFVASLAAFVVSLVYHYLLSDGGAVMGTSMAFTDALIAASLILFAWYARAMAARGILR